MGPLATTRTVYRLLRREYGVARWRALATLPGVLAGRLRRERVELRVDDLR